MPYKLATGKMTNGLLSESSSTMVLPLGQKMGLEAIAPCIYAQLYHQTVGCC
jgi:hypothetical protein